MDTPASTADTLSAEMIVITANIAKTTSVLNAAVIAKSVIAPSV